MKKYFLPALLLLAFSVCGRERIFFGNSGGNWRFIGKIPLVRATSFTFSPGPENGDRNKMTVSAPHSSGMLATAPEFDLRRTPVMRWRWRMVKPLCVAPGADEKDDQAVAIYVGDGNRFRHRAISYRWEVNADKGRRYRKLYSAGALAVEAFVLRNCSDASGQWVTEERNVVKDYRERFGTEIDRRFAVIVGANTQHLRQHSVAEIDYIEFLTEEEAARDPIPPEER